jgi:tetratricopeptide (TPR) repeat protein
MKMLPIDSPASQRNHARSRAVLACGWLAVCLLFSGCSPEAREARYLKSGKAMMERKDYSRAVIQFRNAIQAKPRDAEPYYQLAMAYLALRDGKLAYANLLKAVDLNPKHQQAQLKLAEILGASGIATKNPSRLQEAQQKLQTLLDAGENNAEILGALAGVESGLGNQADAEKHLEEAVAKFPKDLGAIVALARVKRARNDLAGAEELLTKAAAQQPPSANAFLALGQYYLSVNKPAEAEKQFQRAHEIEPKSSAPLQILAALQTRMNKVDEAEKAYAQLAALPDPRFRLTHAAFQASRGKSSEAIAETEKLNKQYPDDRNVRTLLAQQYIRAQRSPDAEKLVSAALKKNPKDVDALLQRSAIYLGMGRVDDAQKDTFQALRFRADSAEAHYLMARVYQSRGDVLKQRQVLNEAVRLRPDMLAARLDLAQMLLASNAAQAALELLEAKDMPAPQRNTLGYLIARNRALIALNQTEDARKEVDRGLAIVKAPELYLQDGYLKMEKSDFEGARASLGEALRRRPEDMRLLRMMVRTYVSQKKPDAAVKMVQDYATQHPKSARVQELLAEVSLASGQRQQARAALMAAKAADPDFTPAELGLAQMDMAEGREKEATATLNSLVQRNGKNVAARMMLAAIKEKGGNPSAAMEEYKKILEVQPSNVVVLNNLAYDLVEYGNQQEEALKYAQRATELAPDAPAVENTMGWILYRKGLYSMALPYLEKAAEKEPNARRKIHVAMTYIKMGDRERGQLNLLAAAKLDPSIPEIKTAQQMLDSMQGR